MKEARGQEEELVVQGNGTDRARVLVDLCDPIAALKEYDNY